MRLAIIGALAVAFAAGCGDGKNPAGHDAGPEDAGTADASCFDKTNSHDPPLYNEIINACTTAQKIYKDSHPPLLKSDGSLPPLPP
jgi:hypothetical protein